MERERERELNPFPFPFLSFRSGVRYYRSRVRSLSVPVSVPGVCSFFLEQIWNRPVPVTVITVPVTVPARSKNRSGSVPGFRSGHLVTLWNGSCDGPVLVSVITVPGPVPGPFLPPFRVSFTSHCRTLRVCVWVWDPRELTSTYFPQNTLLSRVNLSQATHSDH